MPVSRELSLGAARQLTSVIWEDGSITRLEVVSASVAVAGKHSGSSFAGMEV
jgi:hypothetical protein